MRISIRFLALFSRHSLSKRRQPDNPGVPRPQRRFGGRRLPGRCFCDTYSKWRSGEGLLGQSSRGMVLFKHHAWLPELHPGCGHCDHAKSHARGHDLPARRAIGCGEAKRRLCWYGFELCRQCHRGC